MNELKAFTDRLPGLRPARVTVTLKNGRVLTAEALTNKGDTEDPYSSTEVQEKFMDVARPVLGEARAGMLVTAALSLDAAPSPLQLIELSEAA